MLNNDVEESVIVPFTIGHIKWNCGEFLVCREIRRSDIMGQEYSVRNEMPEADCVSASHDFTNSIVGHFSSWKNLPVIIRVIVRIACDLLTLTRNATIVVTKWVPVSMTV